MHPFPMLRQQHRARPTAQNQQHTSAGSLILTSTDDPRRCCHVPSVGHFQMHRPRRKYVLRATAFLTVAPHVRGPPRLCTNAPHHTDHSTSAKEAWSPQATYTVDRHREPSAVVAVSAFHVHDPKARQLRATGFHYLGGTCPHFGLP